MPDPTPDTMFNGTYAEAHSLVDAEAAEYASYLESFSGSPGEHR